MVLGLVAGGPQKKSIFGGQQKEIGTLGPPKKVATGVATLGPPKKVATGVATLGPPEKEATGVATTNSGQQGSLGGALFFAFLPISSYSSSCILSLCSIYFVVAAASKK